MSPVRIVCPGCVNCQGQAHHWVAVVTGDGVPVFCCRHCEATEELDVHYGFEREDGGPCLTDAEVRIVSHAEGGLVVGDRWRSCIWCHENIPPGREGSTCGRGACHQREQTWVKAHPDSARREQVEIVDDRFC